MANSTIIKGFAPGNRIVVERWGRSAHVVLDPKSMESLREQLYNTLPKQPPPPPAVRTVAQYHPGDQTVSLRMGIDETNTLLWLLSSHGINKDWVIELERCLKEHSTRQSPEGEPGLDDSVDVK